MNGASVSIYNVDEEIVGHSNGLSDLLNSARNHILEQPNMGVVRKERLRRNKMAMKVWLKYFFIFSGAELQEKR